MPISWPQRLRSRRGSPHRLGGLEIYFDFDWRDVFQHNRAVFPNGQSLAQLAARDCPDGKQPTLLLTERADVEPHIRETEDRYVVIVPIHDYLRASGGDAAFTYYARLSGAPVTQLAGLRDVAFSPQEFEEFLDQNLTADELRRWANSSGERRRVVSDAIDAPPEQRPVELLKAAEALATGSVGSVAEVLTRLDSVQGAASLEALTERLTASTAGRVQAGASLGQRVLERIQDTRNEVEQYQALISTQGVTETDVQRFLEAVPWIVGLPYVGARGRVEVPRGEIDFVLDRYDGFFDIVELKGPDDELIAERTQASRAARPASASNYSLGPALAQALAQAHLYRSILDRGRDLHEAYGLTDTRQPRILILIGRSAALTSTGREVLREINLSLHRVEVIPYDLLGKRTAGWLANIENLLSSTSSVPPST